MAEYRLHPIDLQATKAFSPASIAKGYLRALGIEPILERQPDFPAEVLGWATTAFYGGRAECRIRRTPVPVELVDFTSMYPTVDGLLGLWRLLTAERIEHQDATAEVQALLDEIDLDCCFNPRAWADFEGIAEVVPDGEIYPVRARYNPAEPTWNIGTNHLTGRDPLGEPVPLWFTIPDLVAAKLLAGKTPTIIRSIKFSGSGRAQGLKTLALRGEIGVDPRREDFFRAVIEQRNQLPDRAGPTGSFLKVLANAGSYGIFAEMNRQTRPGRQHQTATVHGRHPDPWPIRTEAPEGPGDYCFPPIAAVITGAARLMLALLERCVTDQGGAWAFCDTDSGAIVANHQGGTIPCPGGSHRTDEGEPAVLALTYD
jgi:hypothetical protein